MGQEAKHICSRYPLVLQKPMLLKHYNKKSGRADKICSDALNFSVSDRLSPKFDYPLTYYELYKL